MDLTHINMRNVITSITMAYNKFTTSLEQYCAIFAVHMLEDVGGDTRFRKDVEAKVMVVATEIIIVLVLVWVVLLR